MINNEKGSVMSVAIIVIAILSFSLTSLTAYTYRNASNTNRVIESETSEAVAKRLVNEGLAQLQASIDQKKEEEGIQWFQALTTDPSALMDFEYDSVDGIVAIENALGVNIEKVSDQNDTVDTANSLHQIVFRIAYGTSDSREVVKYLYYTDFGAQYEELDAFEYEMGTNGAVALNGGDYKESTQIYGKSVYTAYSTAYKDSTGDYTVLPAGSYNKPAGYIGPESASFTSPDQYKCPDDGEICLDDPNGDLVLLEDLYNYYDYSETNAYFKDLFMGFDYDDWYFNSLASILGEDENSIKNINYEDNAWYDSLNSLDPETINPQSNLTLTEDRVVDGNLSLDLNGNSLNLNGNTLIVRGDLTIDNLDAISRPGQLYVHGDVIIQNTRNLHMTANLHTYGKIVVDFDEGHGFTPSSTPQGFGLFAKDNILFDSNTTFDPLPIFIFTESSIKFDSAKYPMNLQGSIYAQAEGDGLPDVYIKRGTEQIPFKGILVNSFSGTYDPNNPENDGFIPDGEDIVEPYVEDKAYEPGSLVNGSAKIKGEVVEGVFMKLDQGNGNSKASLKSPSHWEFQADYEDAGNSDNDHSFEFGTLDGGDDSTSTVSIERDLLLMNRDRRTPRAIHAMENVALNSLSESSRGVNRLSVTKQNTMKLNSLVDTFYGLPSFKQLIVSAQEDDELISETSTFQYEPLGE